MRTLPFLRAELLSLLLEALLFGCFAILYPISLWILVYRHRRDGRRYTRHGIWLFSIVTVMFLLAMIHLIFNGLDCLIMFADHSTTADGPYLFYISGREDGTAIPNMLFVVAVTFVGDSFMTYRVFTMWGRSWKSIFIPTSLILGAVGKFSVVLLMLEAHVSGLPLAQALYIDKVNAMMTTYLALVLATNIATVALIIGRLMWHERMVRLHHVDEISGPSIQRTVVRTIIQSEALYSATIVGTLVSCAARSEAFFVCTSMVAPLVGISFTLIITHIGFDDIKRQMTEANNADLSRLDFQRVVDSSGEDSSRSIIVPATLVLSNSGDSEKGVPVDGTTKHDNSTPSRIKTVRAAAT
ncbi:uncharacterized protein TRAVEDRAFT_53233 [Trametes versicolor FP-101664 SS1]|uniref:uncharacterized protein n=1 Tax=Trametes versicolor (strain FP-101664) TaxID=717944 RepID=UPI00046224B7|nr:uncharacterized protein TRAVEDRAFT_53233 [Trametes versicolor FP-101664 SS1]EIW52793.1 hypothetical protein TRAVEDRAFT_53233 [Trametes versicolor FP-101664 SS1]